MTKRNVPTQTVRAATVLAPWVLVVGMLGAPRAVAQSAYFPLVYSARLSNAEGAPLSGPLDIDVKFYSAETGGTQLGNVYPYTAVFPIDGVMNLSINLMPLQVEAIFGDGSQAVFIEITVEGKTYPRQRYSFVPLALRVPVDKKTVSFGDDGKLGLSLKTLPAANQFLTKNASGELVWGTPITATASSIQGRNVSASVPSAGQVLTYSGTEWVPQTLTGSGSISGTLDVAGGGTGATSFTNNGILVGAGAGPVSATAAGTAGNVLVVGASGPEFSRVNLGSSAAVSGLLAATNGGTGISSTATFPATGVIVTRDASETLTNKTLSGAVIGGNGSVAGRLVFNDGGNTNYVAFKAPNAFSGQVTWELPSSDGSPGQVLATNGAGTLGWVSVGAPTGAASGDLTGNYPSPTLASVGTAGTYIKVTTDSKGRVISGATLSSSDLPPISASSLTTGTLGVANGGTGASTKSGAFDALSPMSAAGDLIYGGASGTGTKLAGNVTTTKQFLTSTGTGTAATAPAWAALTAADIPPMVGADGTAAGVTGAVPAPAAPDNGKYLRGDGIWATPAATAGGSDNQIQYNSNGTLTGNSNFVYASGNVGIGTTAPSAALDLNGQLKIQGGSPGAGKVLTSDANGLATWSTAAVGSITGVTAGTGLSGGGTSGSVTLNADVGTTANKLVQLDATAKLPAVDGSALTNLAPSNLSSAVGVAKGGTGITSGISGGIPYFSATNTMTSSAALTSNGVVLGGGAGAAPIATAAGAANTVLRVPSGGGAPGFGAIDVSQSGAVTGTLNLGNGGTGASLLLTGGTGQYLKQTASGAAVSVGTIAASDLPAMVGDAGSGGIQGAVPAAGSGDAAAGKFLKADGTWSIPTGTTNWAAPGAIGSTTPNSGSFTTLTMSGNVGIGSTSPTQALDVSGTGVFNGLQTNEDTTKRLVLGRYSSGEPFSFLTPSANSSGFKFNNAGVTAEILTILNNGNIGLSTSAPTAMLSLNGAAARTIQVERNTVANAAGSNLTLQAGGATALVADKNGGTLFIASGTATGTGTSNLEFQTANAGASGTTDRAATTKMVINGAGNLGIGTTAPAALVQVGADNTDGRIYIDGAGSSTNPLSTARPTNDNAHLIIGRPNITSADAGGIEFITSPSGAGYGWKLTAPDTGGGTTSFRVHSRAASSTWSERLTINNAGNVGIGTTSPAGKLDVAGSICLNGANCITSWPSAGGYWATSGSDSYVASGKLGVGTSSPGADLSFGGSLSRTIQVDRNTGAGTAGGGLTVQAGGAISGGNNYNGGTLTLASGVATGTGTSSIEFKTASAGSSGATDSAPTTKMTILGNGNVGIGISNPAASLHIYNSTNGITPALSLENLVTTYGDSDEGPAITWKTRWNGNGATYDQARIRGIDDNIGGYGSGAGGLAFDTISNSTFSERMRISSNGNVGIGTTAPAFPLQVNGSTIGETRIQGSTHSKVSFRNTAAGTDQKAWQIYAGQPANQFVISALNDAENADNIALAINRGSGTAISSVTFPTGNVGIGTTAPANTLEVKNSAGYAAMGTNPLTGQLNLSSSSQRLVLGSFYTGGVGAASAIQATDTYSGLDHGDNLALNPLGGNVGIGTTNPTQTFVVNGVGNITGLGVGAVADSNVGTLRVSQNSGTVPAVRTDQSGAGPTAIFMGGNVGIGTTAPGYSLDVAGVTRASSPINSSWVGAFTGIHSNNKAQGFIAGQVDNAYWVGVAGQSNQTNGIGVYGLASGTGGWGGYFTSSNGPALLTGSGNVGIGTTNPSTVLQINSSGTPRGLRLSGLTSGSTNYQEIQMAGDGNEYRFGVGGSAEAVYGVANKFYLFDLNASAMRMVLDSNGRVGIGTVNPNDKLHVVGNVSTDSISVGPYLSGANAGIELGNSSAASTTPYIDFHYGTGSAQDYNSRIMNPANNLLVFTNMVGTPLSLNGSNVGIGTTSPGAKLHVAGTSGTDGIMFPDGTLQKTAAVGGVTSWTNAGAATITAVTTSPTKGTTTTDAVMWRRVGDTMELNWNYVQTSGGTVGSGYYLFTLPGGYSIDTSKLSVPSSAIDYRAYVGTFAMSYLGYCTGNVYAYNTTQLFAEMICYNGGAGAGPWGSGYSTLTGAIRIGIHAHVPISGW